VVGFGEVCSFFSPALDACVFDRVLDCFGGRTAHSHWRALALVFVFCKGLLRSAVYLNWFGFIVVGFEAACI
jgi:hypothetical protein